MWTNPQCPADLVALTEEILNEELHFLCSVTSTTLPGDCLWNISFLILITNSMIHSYRSRRPEVLLGKSVLKICSKFTEEHPCRSVILIKLLWNRFLAWVFSCKFAANFQNTFSYKHLWTATSILSPFRINVFVMSKPTN